MSENPQLSERELEILRLVATGASNKEIATQLVISANTVKVHMRNIFSKLEVSSRTEATMWAVRQGMVDVPAQYTEPQDSQEDLSLFAGWIQRNPHWIIIAVFAVLIILWGIVAWQFSNRNSQEPVTSPELDRWQELANLSSPRSKFAFAVYENQLYTIGGQSGDQVIDRVERYDPQSGIWIKLAEKPTPVSEVGAAVIGGRIFIPGGRLASGDVTNIVEVFDPKENEWSQTTPLPIALSAYAIAAYEGKLYIFGGWDGDQFIDRVYEFDPSTESWDRRQERPVPSGFSSAAVLGNRIYVLGGFDGEKILNRNDIYLPGELNQPWQEGAPIPNGRYGHGVTSLGDVLYLIGGISEDGENLSFQFLPQENSWQQFGNLVDQTWSYMGILPLGSDLHIWGGELDGSFSDQHWSYQALYTLNLPVIQQ